MPALIGLLLLLGVSLLGGGSLPFGGPLIPGTPAPEGAGTVCIDPVKLLSDPVLVAVPKATEENTPFPKTGGCPSGSCTNQPEVSDYVLAALNVKIEKVWPHPPTTRLYKQKLPQSGEANYRAEFESIRDLIYRASCNDWCQLGLPYGGTYHCDFIWLYKEDRFVDKNGEKYPEDTGCNLKTAPDKCPTFDVLIRKAEPWPIPAEINCQNVTPTPISQKPDPFFGIFKKALAAGQQVLAQTESFINLDGFRWIYASNPARPVDTPEHKAGTYTLKKDEMRTAADPATDLNGGRTWVGDNVVFRGIVYRAYKNLTNKINLTDDYLYLVEQIENNPPRSKVEEAEGSPDLKFKFDYLEFRKSADIKPQKSFSLQLGTFQVPVGEGWWKEWVKESKPAIYLYPEEPTALRVKLNPAGELLVSDPPYDSEKGWEIVAYPDGSIKLANGTPACGGLQLTANSEQLSAVASPKLQSEGERAVSCKQTYPYLFYEANLEKVYVEPKGFVVRGAELVDFFKRELRLWGLNEKETADFIEYWMSRLDENQPYYFIHFLDNEQIEKLEPLEIYQLSTSNFPARNATHSVAGGQTGFVTLTQPQTSIRIRTYFKPLSSPFELGEISPQTPPSIPPRQGFTLVEWGGILD